jgi:hypothetical protein
MSISRPEPVDHAALRAEIDAVRDRNREAFDAMWHAMQDGTRDEYAAALETWRTTNIELDTLIRAGVLITLGPLGDTDK